MFTWGFLEWDSQCIDFHRWSFVRKLRLDVQEQSEDDKLCMGKVGYYWWWIEAYPPSWAAAEVARRASVSFCSAFFSSSNFWWELCNAVISARSSMATSSVEPSFSNRILASSFSLFVTSWKKIEHVYLIPIFRNFITEPLDRQICTFKCVYKNRVSQNSSIQCRIFHQRGNKNRNKEELWKNSARFSASPGLQAKLIFKNSLPGFTTIFGIIQVSYMRYVTF